MLACWKYCTLLLQFFFFFLPQHKLITAQFDSQLIKPQGGNTLFLALIKRRTCCSSQILKGCNAQWNLVERNYTVPLKSCGKLAYFAQNWVSISISGCKNRLLLGQSLILDSFMSHFGHRKINFQILFGLRKRNNFRLKNIHLLISGGILPWRKCWLCLSSFWILWNCCLQINGILNVVQTALQISSQMSAASDISRHHASV